MDQTFRTIKCPLKGKIKKEHRDWLIPKIEDVVFSTNKIAVIAYQFIKSYILYKYSTNQPLPNLDLKFIEAVLYTLNHNHNKSTANLDEKEELRQFFLRHFRLDWTGTLDYERKSYIIAELAKEMETCIKTNISTHIKDYIGKYINVLYKNDQVKLLKTKEEKAQLYKEIKNLKEDIRFCEIRVSDPKYHPWLEEFLSLFPNDISVCPATNQTDVLYDVKCDPVKYLWLSIYINSQIESRGYKCYQVIPQRTSIVPKSITINTPALLYLVGKRCRQLFGNCVSKLVPKYSEIKQKIWLKLFDIPAWNNRIFFGQIDTDGISCSLIYEKRAPKVPKISKEEFPNLYYLNETQRNKYKDRNIVGLYPGVIRLATAVDSDGNIFKYSSKRRWNECYIQRYNEVLLAEKNRTTVQLSLGTLPTTNTNVVLSVIDKTDEDKNDKKKKGNRGKGKNGRKSKNKEKYPPVKTTKTGEIRPTNVTDVETYLSIFKSKTLNSDKYSDYIKQKNRTNDCLGHFYQQPLFRKMKFRIYSRTQQEEAKMLNEFENKFGKDPVICYGNWSRKSHMKGRIPTPKIGFKRLFGKRFDVLTTDEFMTSQIYNRDHSIILEKIKIGGKKFHEVLTPKEETGKYIRVNRDVNAAKNMLSIGISFLKTSTKLSCFRRKMLGVDNVPVEQTLRLRILGSKLFGLN